MLYIYYSILAFALGAGFTYWVRRFAIRLNIVDLPDNNRKKHRGAVPLLGGLGVFLAFFLVLFFARNQITAGNLGASHWLGVFAGAAVLMIGGFLDDKYHLKPSRQIIFPILAAIMVIAGGVEIAKITNPFGGFIYLDAFQIPILQWGGAVVSFMVLSDTLVFLWLMGMMYTTKLLDGLDGLVTSVSAVGGIIIFLFTSTTRYYQPDIALASIIFAGASLGFLIFNWHPAKIFLGEAGSLFMGFILGALSIISGGKIAIALLIMGIPILDTLWTIIRRVVAGQNPLKHADRLHLHFRLHDLGLGHQLTTLVYCLFAAAFGLSALFLQSRGKIVVLLVLIGLMLALIGFLRFKQYRATKEY